MYEIAKENIIAILYKLLNIGGLARKVSASVSSPRCAMAQDFDCRFPSLVVSAHVASELTLLDEQRYDRFCIALEAADETLHSRAEALPLDGLFILTVFEVSLLIRFHDAEQRFYVCAYLFETDIEPDPRDPPPAGHSLPHDWIGDAVLVDVGFGARKMVLARRPKILMSAGLPTARQASRFAMLGGACPLWFAETTGSGSTVLANVNTATRPAQFGGRRISNGLCDGAAPTTAYREMAPHPDDEQLIELELFPAMLAARLTGIVRHGAFEGSVDPAHRS